jgi:hypothetical protein
MDFTDATVDGMMDNKPIDLIINICQKKKQKQKAKNR